jgi:hypothetical protein
MRIEKAIEVFRELLDEQRYDDGSMCSQPHYCEAFRKSKERPTKCPFIGGSFGPCETCDRIIAFDTIVHFVNKARAKRQACVTFTGGAK